MMVTTTAARVRTGALLVMGLSIACGGDGGVSAPTAPTAATPRGALSITTLDVSAEHHADGSHEISLTLHLRETGGQALTVNSATVAFLDAAGNAMGQGTVQNPVGGTNRLAPHQELTTHTMVATVPRDETYPKAVRVTVAFVDDGRVSGTATAQADVPALPLATITGVIRHGVTLLPLPDVTISVTAGPSLGRSTVTDGNGFYSIAVDHGPINLKFESVGFATIVRAFTVAGDTSLGLNLDPLFNPSPPPPATGCQGVPSSVSCGRPSARCRNGQWSCSTNRSGTCSSNGGVSCWVCPGPLC